MEWTTVYVLVVIFLATMVRSTIGFGEALVAVPLLALRIPVAVAAPVVVAVSVIVAAANLLVDWRHVEIRSARSLVLSSLVGLPLGILLLRAVDDRIVKLLLGAIIIGVAAYSLMQRERVPARDGSPGWVIPAGVASGILGGAYGMNGPPLVIYGTLRGWSPTQFRATLQGYFLIASLAGLIGYVLSGMWRPASTRYLLLSLPFVLSGILIARLLNQGTDRARFFRLVHAGMLLIGVVLAGQALVG